MKKNYFFTALALCGLLTFTSCGNDDDPISNGPDTEVAAGDQVIVLDMQDTDVLSTKSRPLYSTDSKGADQVTDVQLLLFGYKNGEKTYKFVKRLKAINNWDNSSDIYPYGRKMEIKLKGVEKLSASDFNSYIILAVGQDESNTKDASPAPFKIKSDSGDKYVSEITAETWLKNTIWNVAAEPGLGFWQTAALDYTKPGTRAGEIFSGVSTPIEFTADGGFSTTVLLKRQVAGVMGYFSRIPSAVNETNVTGIRLVSSNRNESIDLSTSLKDQVDDQQHGKPGYKNTESVINGFTTSTKNNPDARFGIGDETTIKDAFKVYEIDLKKWFTWTGNGWDTKSLLDETGENGQTLLGKSEGWSNALDPSNSTNITLAAGSVFAGEFVIPFERSNKNTFELQLINTADNGNVKVLKTWTVKLDDVSQVGKDTDKVYSIYRNHLYQVGKRANGDTPVDPGTDPDKPQPLDKDQELIIKINDQWEFIHDMEID